MGFEVCSPQQDMKDKQVRQRTRTVLRGNSTNAKKKKRWKMASSLYPTIQADKRGIAYLAWTLSKACASFLVTQE